MKNLLAILLLLPSILLAGTGRYVARTNGGTGAGTVADPWTLEYALHSAYDEGKLFAGDTVYCMDSGRYTYHEIMIDAWGTADHPIIFKPLNNKRVIWNTDTTYVRSGHYTFAYLTSTCDYLWFWGIEFACMDTRDRACEAGGSWPPGTVDIGSSIDHAQGNPRYDIRGIKFINCIVHDISQGISKWCDLKGFEYYGNLLYNLGWDDVPDTSHFVRGHGHNFYMQNDSVSQALVKDNISNDGYGCLMGTYGSDAEGAYTDSMWIEGNIIQGVRTLSAINPGGGNRTMLLGRQGSYPANAARWNTVRKNMIIQDWNPPNDGHEPYGMEWGYNGGLTNCMFDSNVVIDGNIGFLGGDNNRIQYNLFAADTAHTDDLNAVDWPNNTWYVPVNTHPTTGKIIFVRPNKYERKRAHVGIVNWGSVDSVWVNIRTAGFSVGDTLRWYNAHNIFEDIPYTCMYADSVKVPMMATRWGTADPIGDQFNYNPANPYPRLGAFIVLSRALDGAAKAKPTNGNRYISVNGGRKPFADGSLEHPWALGYGLHADSCGLSEVAGGDTIFIKEGVYYLDSLMDVGLNIYHRGTSNERPLIIRNYADEEVKIVARANYKGFEIVNGATDTSKYVWLWGLEFAGEWDYPRDTTVGVVGGFVVNLGRDCKIINCIIHDLRHGDSFSGGVRTEWYGNLIYFIGYNYEHSGYAMYSQNRTGRKLFEDNIWYKSFRYTIHIYGSSASQMDTIVFRRNVLAQPSFLFGRYTTSAFENVRADTIDYNHFYPYLDCPVEICGYQSYANPGYQGGMWKGVIRNNWCTSANGTDNCFQLNDSAKNWTSGVIVENNRFYGYVNYWSGKVTTTSTHWPNNEYLYGKYPKTGDTTFLFTNKYDRKRANLVIYNYGKSDSVSVPVSSQYNDGDMLVLRNVFNYFGSKPETVLVSSGKIRVPMSPVRWPYCQPSGDSTKVKWSNLPGWGTFIVSRIPAGAVKVKSTQKTYYVSSSGSDANNGTSPATPWKTIAKTYNGAKYHPGDSILFKRGDTLEGQFYYVSFAGTPDSPIVIGAYGTGERPIIRGDMWGRTLNAMPGRPGYYWVFVDWRGYFMGEVWEKHDGAWDWLAGKSGWEGANLQDWLDTLEAGRWGPSSWSDTLYIHVMDSVHTTRDSLVLTRVGSWFNSCKHLVIRDIWFQYVHNGIYATGNDSCIVRNVKTGPTRSQGIMWHTGSNSLIDSCKIDTAAYTSLYCYLGHNNIFRANTISNVLNNYLGIVINAERCGIGVQGSASMGYDTTNGRHTIEYNVFNNIYDAGFDSFYNVGDTIRYNTFNNIGGTAMWLMGRNCVYKGNIVNGNGQFEGFRGGFVNGYSEEDSASVVPLYNEVSGNFFYDCLGYAINITNGGENLCTLTVSNNVIEGSVASTELINDLFPASNLVSVNNSFCGSGKYWWGTVQYPSNNLAGFQAASGLEFGSTYSSECLNNKR